jgi:hypothetical protein
VSKVPKESPVPAIRFLPPIALAAKWLARTVSLGLLILVATFVIGEGPPPLSVHSAAFGMILAGLLLGLFRDGAGAVVTLAGLASFYVLNYWASGLWPSGAFPLFFVPPGLLLVSCWLTRWCRGTGALARGND